MSSVDPGVVPQDASDNALELIVAIVALIISVFAFVIGILQALQQYYASATGFSSVSAAKIGKWAQFSKRYLCWSEFRFEVHFDQPVIFVAMPDNKRGPMGEDPGYEVIPGTAPKSGKTIVFLDGKFGTTVYTADPSEKKNNVKDEKMLWTMEKSKQQQDVRTVDNETATWYEMLSAIVQMEHESQEWQKEQQAQYNRGQGPPRGNTLLSSPTSLQSLDLKRSLSPPGLMSAPQTPAEPKTMVVCVQRKRRTWDSMPKDLDKPYATTTMAHIVEIAAMLGIYWKKFDLDENQYRAHGNGFMLQGSYKSDLGIIFTFQTIGKATFQSRRLVNNYNTKKLCFGIVPTLFKAAHKGEGGKNLQLLKDIHFGSVEEIAHTLETLGCDIETANYFRKNSDEVRRRHLFPVPFEIIGMVGDLLHMENTLFRTLPNPVAFAWDPATFSLADMLSEHVESIGRDRVLESSKHAENISKWYQNRSDIEFGLLNMQTGLSDKDAAPVNNTGLIEAIDHLRKGILLCDEYLTNKMLVLARRVMVAHLQEVLAMLNEDANSTVDGAAQISIAEVDSDPTEYRDRLLIELYHTRILPRVIAAVSAQDTASRERHLRRSQTRKGAGNDADITRDDEQRRAKKIREVWATLVLRMLCWLQLHKFNPADVQVHKTDVYESRMPVYVT